MIARAMGELVGVSMPMFDSSFHHSKAPIAYCSFLNKTMYNPVCNPNAVFVPVIDAVHGPVARVKALRPLKEGGRLSKILPY